MQAIRVRPPRDTGPLEVRDYGPNGRKLGTFADCYDGSPWELHRGELVEPARTLLRPREEARHEGGRAGRRA